MPPKSVPAAGAMPDPQLQFLFSALKHSESLKINWDEVAKENGIGYARNAATKFKNFVAKQGFKYENNSISPADGTAVKTPKTTPSRKRKVKDENDGQEKTPSKAPKKKVASAVKNEPVDDDLTEDDDLADVEDDE
ncbi:hypothetical protein H2204_006439 [Knufia peltigerae]|uniref:Myb-like DNA-binding domain-containing protein n=1 Tax=Knufia peltigerae TaxID=1002370 RepID=A0AA38Y3H8_9EURO|nr:hypothetical protein H2204_006439 [Knufia peltigerae]